MKWKSLRREKKMAKKSLEEYYEDLAKGRETAEKQREAFQKTVAGLGGEALFSPNAVLNRELQLSTLGKLQNVASKNFTQQNDVNNAVLYNTMDGIPTSLKYQNPKPIGNVANVMRAIGSPKLTEIDNAMINNGYLDAFNNASKDPLGLAVKQDELSPWKPSDHPFLESLVNNLWYQGLGGGSVHPNLDSAQLESQRHLPQSLADDLHGETSPTPHKEVSSGEDVKGKEDETSNGNGGSEDAVIDVENKSYQDILDAYLGNLGNFSYNPNTDAMYQSYLATMQNLGQRAMKDTMGQASALTGGYGSSYAQNAGGNAYNQYLESAGQAMPTFYNMAYNQYRDSVNDKLNALNSATSSEGNISAKEFANILDKVINSKEPWKVLDTLEGYNFSDEQTLAIGDAVNKYGGTKYTLKDQSKFLFFNKKGNDTLEVTAPDGSTKEMTIDEAIAEGELSKAEADELKKLKVGESWTRQ